MRINEAFFPRNFISKGNVINPTLVRVIIKIATWGIPAPFSNISFSVGKTEITGNTVNEPAKEARNIPVMPDLIPNILAIFSISIIEDSIPADKVTKRN